MKTSTLKEIFLSIMSSLIIHSLFISPDSVRETLFSSVISGMNFLGVVLIGAILYLGYYARNRYEEHHRANKKKS